MENKIHQYLSLGSLTLSEKLLNYEILTTIKLSMARSKAEHNTCLCIDCKTIIHIFKVCDLSFIVTSFAFNYLVYLLQVLIRLFPVQPSAKRVQFVCTSVCLSVVALLQSKTPVFNDHPGSLQNPLGVNRGHSTFAGLQCVRLYVKCFMLSTLLNLYIKIIHKLAIC